MIQSRTRDIRLSTGLLLLIPVLVMLVQVGEVASATTTVEAGSISLYPGGTGNVPITVKDITANSGLGAYELKVTFNPSVVEVLEVTGGTSPFNSVTANIDNTAGQVTFNSFQPSIPGPKGSITVAYLKVKAVGGAGSSSVLTVSYIDLADTEGNLIQASPVHGSVTIKAPKSASSISIALDRDEVRVAESVTVSGRISPSHAASVTLSFTRPDETRVSKTASAGSDGSYSYLFEPDVAGAWKVSASWLGDSDHSGASSSTAKFLVTKLSSSLSVLVSPTVLEPEGSLRVEGFVLPERDGAAIKLEYKPHEGDWMPVAEVSSNSTGRFSYDWETGLNASGQYEVRAFWLGDHVFEGVESSPVLFYIVEDSALSISLSSLSTGLSGTVVVRGEVSPLHAYTGVTLSVEAPNGTVLGLTTQTDVAGNYKVSFVPDTVGIWRFESSWPGDFNTHGSRSFQVELQVILAGSSISMQSNVPSVTKGSQITLSGEIEPSPSGATVMLELTRPDSSLVTVQAESTSEGIFSVDYAPDQAGVWLAQASWPGNSEYGGATSRPASFTVDKSPSTLSLSVNPPIPKKGDLVMLEGALDPATSSGFVEVLVSEDGGGTWSAIAPPAIQSGREYSGSWRAEEMGTFCFKAIWKGDDEHSGCASPLIRLIIQEGVVSVSVLLADGHETQVVSSTNSSTSTVSADPANGRIDIEVSGPNGTRGSMNIFIPEGLLDSFSKTIDDVVFSVDGTLVSPEVVEIVGGYLATIDYDHSGRTISVHYLTHSIVMDITDYNGGIIVGADVFLAGPVSTRGMTNSSGSVCFPSMPKGNYSIQVYYGGKMGEDTLNLTEDKVLTISTVVGKIEAEYSEILEEYADLEQRYLELQRSLATTQTVMYLYLVTAVAFTLIYLAVKGQDQLYYFARRFSDFWNDVSARLQLQLRRSRRRQRKDKTST